MLCVSYTNPKDILHISRSHLYPMYPVVAQRVIFCISCVCVCVCTPLQFFSCFKKCERNTSTLDTKSSLSRQFRGKTKNLQGTESCAVFYGQFSRRHPCHTSNAHCASGNQFSAHLEPRVFNVCACTPSSVVKSSFSMASTNKYS